MTAKRALELAAVVALVIAALLLVRDHQRLDSPTLDEPYHVFAACEYAVDGTYWINLEHPPLVKLLAGWELRPLRLASPNPGGRAHATVHPQFLRFTYGNRLPADRIVAAARRPMPWILAALVAATWAAGRLLAGPAAGLLAAALVALDPNFIAHAGLVHTDVPAALAFLVTATLGLLAARTARLGLWGAAGLALGLALATKFTAVFLLPALALFPLVCAKRAPLRRNAAGLALAFALGFAVLAGVYAVAMRHMARPDAEAAVRWYLASRGAPPATLERYAALSRAVPPLGHWAAGLKGVALFSEEGRGWNFFHGRLYEGPDAIYFPAAFVIKSTPAFLLLLLGAAALGGRAWRRPGSALVIPAAFVIAAAIGSSFNIGHRHLLPAYPLLGVAAAAVLAERLRPRAYALFAGALALLSALSVARVHPDELSYFNFLVGGPEGGARWLSDSNVDWGQDMKRLDLWLRAHGGAAETTVVAASGLATDYYSRSVRAIERTTPIAPGRYVLGATVEALAPHAEVFLPDEGSRRRLQELVAALHARGRRVARVGGSLTVWELPPG